MNDRHASDEEIARQIQHGIERSLAMQHKPQRAQKQKKRGRSRKRKLTPRR
jgi:hypothetical protein